MPGHENNNYNDNNRNNMTITFLRAMPTIYELEQVDIPEQRGRLRVSSLADPKHGIAFFIY